MKCHLLKILFVFISIHFVKAQTITVIESDTNDPLPGIAIYNLKKTKSLVTNLEGKVDIDIFDDSETIFFQNFLYEKVFFRKSEILKNNGIVVLTPKVEDLSQIVISATKFKQNKADIPQTIISIMPEDVSFANPQTSADLLDDSGNIFVQKSQLGGGSPMIRGFSTNRLLITVDGVRMNNAIFRGGNIQNVISIDPLSIRNTEVTLGAGSVVYGSDAIGGVMSFYTKKPQLSYKDESYISGSSLLRYASANNENTGHFDFNIGFKKWAFLTNVSFTDFDDLRMGSNGPAEYLRTEYIVRRNNQDLLVDNNEPELQKPTGYNQLNLMQKVHYEPTDNLKFDFGLYYTTTSEYARYDRLLRPSEDGLRSAEWNYGPQRWFMSNLQVTKTTSRSNLYDKIHSSLAYQNFKESRIVRAFESPLREIREENVDALTFNLDLEKSLSKSSTLYYGIEYLFNKIGSTGTELNIDTLEDMPAVTRYPDGSTWQSIAGYASLKYKPNQKFVFQTGLRYNHVLTKADFRDNNRFLNLPFNNANINTGALTGTAGITWAPSNMIQWKLNASTAFRAPNIDDIGKVFDSEPGSVVIPNNDLSPEYAYGGELGLKLNFDDNVIVDLGTYYTFLDNALIRRDSNINGETEIIYDGELSNVQSIKNASKAWIYGFEAGIEVNFTDYLKLRSQYNVIGGTEDNDGIEVPVRHVAPNFGRTHLIYKSQNLKLDAFVVYNGALSSDQLAPSELSKSYLYALDNNGNPFSPSWHTFNIRAQYLWNDKISLTASLENITDQRYRPYSSGITAPGRNLILALRYTL